MQDLHEIASEFQRKQAQLQAQTRELHGPWQAIRRLRALQQERHRWAERLAYETQCQGGQYWFLRVSVLAAESGDNNGAQGEPEDIADLSVQVAIQREGGGRTDVAGAVPLLQEAGGGGGGVTTLTIPLEDLGGGSSLSRSPLLWARLFLVLSSPGGDTKGATTATIPPILLESKRLDALHFLLPTTSSDGAVGAAGAGAAVGCAVYPPAPMRRRSLLERVRAAVGRPPSSGLPAESSDHTALGDDDDDDDGHDHTDPPDHAADTLHFTLEGDAREDLVRQYRRVLAVLLGDSIQRDVWVQSIRGAQLAAFQVLHRNAWATVELRLRCADTAAAAAGSAVSSMSSASNQQQQQLPVQLRVHAARGELVDVLVEALLYRLQHLLLVRADVDEMAPVHSKEDGAARAVAAAQAAKEDDNAIPPLRPPPSSQGQLFQRWKREPARSLGILMKL